MIINKQVAIKAIAIEPVLESGHWFSEVSRWNYEELIFQNKMKTCSVCAIGSILRAHCFTNLEQKFDIDKACNNRASFDYYQTCFDQDETNYLGNLSMLFEHMSIRGIDTNSDQMKMYLITYIEMAWPNKFEIGVT